MRRLYLQIYLALLAALALFGVLVGMAFVMTEPARHPRVDAVRAFAGPEPQRAVFYPRDDEYLVDRDLEVSHWEVFEA